LTDNKTPDFFNKMIDELVIYSQHDKELKDGIAWLDGLAQKKGITFYEIMFDVMYKHEVRNRAKEWLNDKNNKLGGG